MYEWARTQTDDGVESMQEDSHYPDDRLRLIFTCCHPALNREAQVALLAMLHDEAGRVVPYKRLYSTMGHRSAGLRQRHILRQHMVGIKKALDKFKAPLALSVSTGVGYALCEVASATKSGHRPRSKGATRG